MLYYIITCWYYWCIDFFDKLPQKFIQISVLICSREFIIIIFSVGFVIYIGLLVFRFKILSFVASEMSLIGARRSQYGMHIMNLHKRMFWYFLNSYVKWTNAFFSTTMILFFGGFKTDSMYFFSISIKI